MGHDHGGEQVGDQTENECDCKASNGTRAKLSSKEVQDERDDDCRDIGVSDRRPGPRKAKRDGLIQWSTSAKLLLDTLKDENITVHRRANRYQEANQGR